MSILDDEQHKYERIWREPLYRVNSPGYRLRDQVLALLTEKGCKSATDFGVGSGKLAKFIQDSGIRVLAYDIADNCLDPDVQIELRVQSIWDHIDPETDGAICTDVLEHIPPEHVDATVANLLQYDTGIVQVHLSEDRFGPKTIGAPLHLTIKPAEWWVEKFASKSPTSEARGPVVTIWW